MELRDQVAVVTGGASGIGRALALRFADEGAAGVVVADLDGAGAEAVAAQLGGRGLGMACDVADEAQVGALVDAAEERFGPVDLFCANAGVGAGSDPMSPDADWDLSFAVNVRAHVLAARAAAPRLARARQGPLPQHGLGRGPADPDRVAPYAVSKHAAVAFAEWLAITYGDRGVGASCLCPMGVNTPLLHAGEEAGGVAAQATAVVQAAGRVLEPEEVADVVVQGLREGRFLLLPHPEVHEFLRRKADDPDRWIAGMRRLQAHVTT